MDVFVFIKNESEPRTVVYKLKRKSNFGEVKCKLRQYLNMTFWNLSQSSMDIIISGLKVWESIWKLAYIV